MGTGADRKVLKYHYKHHEYIGQHPKDRKTGWCDNLNGVAHDNDYWYFTQAAGLTTDDTLWKFPVTYDLNNGPEGTVAKCGIPEELADRFYHFGALDCYDGYLFVPVYKKDDPERIEVFLIAGVLVFKAENLEYIGEAPLMGYSPGFPPQTGAPWCAVNPQDGLLYSCNNNIKLASPFVFRYKYQINEQDRKVTLTPQEPFRLFLVQDLNYMQGGAFSTSGELYLMNGFESDFKPEDGGISLFDGDGRIIGRSHQGGSFRFEFHPGTIQREEPEGLTYWDLDTDGRAPNIGGQVHAIMLDNESLSEDDLYFKHYRVSQRPFFSCLRAP